MTGKAAQSAVIEGKGSGHGLFHPFRKWNTHRVNVGPGNPGCMAAVAELNGITVKSERRFFILRLALEVALAAVFPGPVGINYFLDCCSGRGITG